MLGRSLLLVVQLCAQAVPFTELLNATELRSTELRSSSVFDWIADVGDVETDCVFRVRVGLESGTPLLRLILKGHVVDVDPRIKDPPKGPLLCHTKKTEGPALLSVVSSVDYLWRMWPYFANKVMWTASVGMPYFLWIGELPTGVAHGASEDCIGSREYDLLLHTDRFHHFVRTKASFYDQDDSSLHSNHHVKLLATLAAFGTGNISGLYYFDMDVIIPSENFHNTSKYEDLLTFDRDDKVDVLFGDAVPGKLFWHVKSMYYYVRNTPLGRRFFATWFGFRCGFKDQYALWHTTLTLARQYHCLDYHGEIYNLDYDAALKASNMTKTSPNLGLTCRQRSTRCPDFKFCLFNRILRTDLFIHQSIRGHYTTTFDYGDWNLTVQDRLFQGDSDDIINRLGLHTSIIKKVYSSSDDNSGLLPP